MKKIPSMMTIGLLVLAACGGDSTKPGTGADFQVSTTAAELFGKTTFYPYVPTALSLDDNFSEGTADCAGGGTATISNETDGDKITSHVVYDGCVGDTDYKHDGYVDLTIEKISTTKSINTLVQHDSLSGVFGFAADCEFTFESGGSSLVVTGDGCTYTDGSGQELVLTTEQIKLLL